MKQPRNLINFVAMGVLLITIVCMPVDGQAQWFQVLQNAGHGVIFAAIAFLCISILTASNKPLGWSMWSRCALTLAIATLLGVVTELLQIPLARDSSFIDVRNDALGACIGLMIFAGGHHELAFRKRLGLVVAGATAVAVLGAPVATCIAAYARRETMFPTIADFRQSMDLYFVAAQWATIGQEKLPKSWSAAADERAMHVRFGVGPWPGVDFFEPAPDWQEYDVLALDLTNPGPAPLLLRLRVHDLQHNNAFDDRFNTTFQIQPGERAVFRFPLAEIRDGPRQRMLSMADIRDLLLFVAGDANNAASELFVSRIWLE
jgi:hypothetical protein